MEYDHTDEAQSIAWGDEVRLRAGLTKGFPMYSIPFHSWRGDFSTGALKTFGKWVVIPNSV